MPLWPGRSSRPLPGLGVFLVPPARCPSRHWPGAGCGAGSFKCIRKRVLRERRAARCGLTCPENRARRPQRVFLSRVFFLWGPRVLVAEAPGMLRVLGTWRAGQPLRPLSPEHEGGRRERPTHEAQRRPRSPTRPPESGCSCSSGASLPLACTASEVLSLGGHPEAGCAHTHTHTHTHMPHSPASGSLPENASRGAPLLPHLLPGPARCPQNISTIRAVSGGPLARGL